MMRRGSKTTAWALAMGLSVSGTACLKRGDARAPENLRVGQIRGEVRYRATSASSWQRIERGAGVPLLGEIQTMPGAMAVLRAGKAGAFELGERSHVVYESVGRVSLETGAVLVRATAPLIVRAGALQAGLEQGLYRVDSRFAVRVGSYRGVVVVSSGTSRISVPALRQVEVAGGIFQRETTPLRITTRDPWDRRALADVFDLDRQLRSYARAFEATLSDRAKDPKFYSALAGRVPAPVFARYLADRVEPGDLLFGVLMAIRLRRATEQGIDGLLELRDAGATWGMIARLNLVNPKTFIAQVTGALIPVAPVAGPTPPPSTRPRREPPPGPRATRSPGASPSPSPSPSPTSPSSPSPSPSPCTDPQRLLGLC